MCFDLTHAPVATTARAAATGPVSMSTRPDPEGSDTVEIAVDKPALHHPQNQKKEHFSLNIVETGVW